MQGRRVHSRRRKSAFPGAPGRSKGRSSIGRFPRFSCGALKRRSFGGPRKRVPSCAGNTSAAKPPRAPPSASDEPPGHLFCPARSPQTKTEQTKVETPASGILRRQSRLVRRLRRRTNRRVSSSTRQGRQYKKMSTLMRETVQRESTDTPEGVPSVGLRRKRLARTAGFPLPPGKVVNTKK